MRKTTRHQWIPLKGPVIRNAFPSHDVTRVQSRYWSSQWETLLHCSDVSHWLGAYLYWSQCHHVKSSILAIGDPCGSIVRQTRGEITSPNYPGRFPTHTACLWRIIRPVDGPMTIKFPEFNMEGPHFGSKCDVGFLKVNLMVSVLFRMTHNDRLVIYYMYAK